MSLDKRTCPNCSTAFEPHDRRQKYCTKRCKHRAIGNAYARRTREPKPPVERVCIQCMAPFLAKRKDKKYCSDACGGLFTATAWAKRNPEKAKANKKKYADEHKDKVLARRAEYRNANRDTLRKKSLEYYRRHKARYAARQKAKYEESPERFAAASRRWEKANPEAMKAKKYRRRARCSSGVGVVASDLRLLAGVLGCKCLACGSTERLTWDHVAPLAAGGTNEPTNLQPLCRSCNSRKGARAATDYRTPIQIRVVGEVFGEQRRPA